VPVTPIAAVPGMLDGIERDLAGLREPSPKDLESLLTRQVEALLVIMRNTSSQGRGGTRQARNAAMSAADDCVHIVMRLVSGDKNPEAVANELANALPLLRRAWWAQVAETSRPTFSAHA
jgi:hypothetical protein